MNKEQAIIEQAKELQRLFSELAISKQSGHAAIIERELPLFLEAVANLKAEPAKPKLPDMDKCQIAVKVVDMGGGMIARNILKGIILLPGYDDRMMFESKDCDYLLKNCKAAVTELEVKRKRCINCSALDTLEKNDTHDYECCFFDGAIQMSVGAAKRLGIDCKEFAPYPSDFTVHREIRVSEDVVYHLFGYTGGE